MASAVIAADTSCTPAAPSLTPIAFPLCVTLPSTRTFAVDPAVITPVSPNTRLPSPDATTDAAFPAVILPFIVTFPPLTRIWASFDAIIFPPRLTLPEAPDPKPPIIVALPPFPDAETVPFTLTVPWASDPYPTTRSVSLSSPDALIVPDTLTLPDASSP